MSDYDLLPAGRELDVEIGRKVLRLFVIFEDSEYKVVSPRTKRPGLLPNYSTNEEAISMLIDVLQHKGYFCKIGTLQKDEHVLFRCSFVKEGETRQESYGDTLPHAVALASLELIGEV